eukprot:9251441-Pyramimonas_sp.AAC.1
MRHLLLLPQGTPAQCGNFFCPTAPQLNAASSAAPRQPSSVRQPLLFQGTTAQCGNFCCPMAPQL